MGPLNFPKATCFAISFELEKNIATSCIHPSRQCLALPHAVGRQPLWGWGWEPGDGTRAASCGCQAKQWGGKLSHNHQVLGLFLIFPLRQELQALACHAEHNVLKPPPWRTRHRLIWSCVYVTWTLYAHCWGGPAILLKQKNRTKEKQWVFIWAEKTWSPLQAGKKWCGPMRHCRKQAVPFRSKDAFYFFSLSKMESNVYAKEEW